MASELITGSQLCGSPRGGFGEESTTEEGQVVIRKLISSGADAL